MGQPASRALADCDQPLQGRPFVCIQGNPVLVHSGTPVLEVVHSPDTQEREDRPTRQSKIDDPLAAAQPKESERCFNAATAPRPWRSRSACHGTRPRDARFNAATAPRPWRWHWNTLYVSTNCGFNAATAPRPWRSPVHSRTGTAGLSFNAATAPRPWRLDFCERFHETTGTAPRPWRYQQGSLSGTKRRGFNAATAPRPWRFCERRVNP